MNYIKLIGIACLTFISIEGYAQGKINRPTKKTQQSSTTSKHKNTNGNGEQQPVQWPQTQPPQSKPTTGTINGHEWVDLGLPSGIKWATCNVGASSPSGYGNYYAWGETTPKVEYTLTNSKTYKRIISGISGSSQHDAARANWGGTWRLPSVSNIRELIDKCEWIWTNQNGHEGYKVVGPNGKYIFLPATGWYSGRTLAFIGDCGSYWSSEPDGDYSKYISAYCLYFKGIRRERNVNPYFREYGRSVRPVSD